MILKKTAKKLCLMENLVSPTLNWSEMMGQAISNSMIYIVFGLYLVSVGVWWDASRSAGERRTRRVLMSLLCVCVCVWGGGGGGGVGQREKERDMICNWFVIHGHCATTKSLIGAVSFFLGIDHSPHG